MRATSMRRLSGGAAALLLVGATLLTAVTPTLAADTRQLYVGSDPGFAANNGVLTFTPVSSGGSSLSSVFVKNIDNQNLTHVVLTFAQTQGSITIGDTVLGANAGSCSASDGTITCDFGSLKARATRAFQLILSSPDAGSFPIHGRVVFNESNNPNGGNQQINAVDGSLAVAATTCDSLATFLPPGIAKTLVPDAGSCSIDAQRSGLTVPASSTGSLVTIDDSGAISSCPSGYSCFGNEVNASVNDGARVTPYLTWFITYSAATLQSINPKQVGFQHGTTVILPGKKGSCGASFTKDCIVGYTVDSTTGAVTFEIRTATNSVMKGLH